LIYGVYCYGPSCDENKSAPSITKIPTRKQGVFPSLRDAKAQGKPSLCGAKFRTRGHPNRGAGKKLRSGFETNKSDGMLTHENRNLNGPATRLLKGVGELQHALLVKRRAKNLQSDRQLSADFSAGDGYSWDTRQGTRNCIDIS
jgi:hypothetical protein